MQISYEGIPAHMRSGTKLYIENGIPPGSFLTAVICNDLFLACGKADDINRHVLWEWCKFFYNEAPSTCFGSPEKMNKWMNHRGLDGIAKQTD